MLTTLTNMWKEYDKLAVKWGMYKVETIGDAYVGVIGCPDKKPDHAEKSVEFAFAIIDMIKNFKTVMNQFRFVLVLHLEKSLQEC